MAIPEPTVRVMLRTVREAAFAEHLPATLVSCLHEVIGADHVTYDEFRRDGATTVADPAVAPEIEDAWALYGHQHPSLPHCRGNPCPGVVRLSDVATQRKIRRLELWSHVWRPLGIRHQLNVPLYEANGLLVGLGLNRCGRDFSDQELAVMELLRVELSRIVAAREAPPFETFQEVGLTRRQAEVLALARRSTNREIAETLGISTRTVEKHLELAYRKLRVSNRREALSAIQA